MNRIFLLVLLLSGTYLPLLAQSVPESNLGIWYMFFNKTEINDRWSVHAEIQDRYLDLNASHEQLLLRTGINHHFNENFVVTAGYGYIETYPNEKTIEHTFKENRIWQQALYLQKIGRFSLEHRGRLEQRFVEDIYKNRVRYRLMAAFPINKETIQAQTFFITAYDELFIQPQGFLYDRNRFYTALGYQFNRGVNLQAGWMSQDVAGESHGYLQVGLFANILRP
ncbi:DUF2490 domain-containing protein [Pararhodonellum marinum]|uniref:DUF2490 domain-containing protein n=1 Tax=Pararhodonellum marinum TaxID=2755358 RepID=UPI00188F5D9A|nr:DUF2490 domain-containing protein [Pararhodonellum marinum]